MSHPKAELQATAIQQQCKLLRLPVVGSQCAGLAELVLTVGSKRHYGSVLGRAGFYPGYLTSLSDKCGGRGNLSFLAGRSSGGRWFWGLERASKSGDRC